MTPGRRRGSPFSPPAPFSPRSPGERQEMHRTSGQWTSTLRSGNHPSAHFLGSWGLGGGAEALGTTRACSAAHTFPMPGSQPGELRGAGLRGLDSSLGYERLLWTWGPGPGTPFTHCLEALWKQEIGQVPLSLGPPPSLCLSPISLSTSSLSLSVSISHVSVDRPRGPAQGS